MAEVINNTNSPTTTTTTTGGPDSNTSYPSGGGSNTNSPGDVSYSIPNDRYLNPSLKTVRYSVFNTPSLKIKSNPISSIDYMGFVSEEITSDTTITPNIYSKISSTTPFINPKFDSLNLEITPVAEKRVSLSLDDKYYDLSKFTIKNDPGFLNFKFNEDKSISISYKTEYDESNSSKPIYLIYDLPSSDKYVGGKCYLPITARGYNIINPWDSQESTAVVNINSVVDDGQEDLNKYFNFNTAYFNNPNVIKQWEIVENPDGVLSNNQANLSSKGIINFEKGENGQYKTGTFSVKLLAGYKSDVNLPYKDNQNLLKYNSANYTKIFSIGDYKEITPTIKLTDNITSGHVYYGEEYQNSVDNTNKTFTITSSIVNKHSKQSIRWYVNGESVSIPSNSASESVECTVKGSGQSIITCELSNYVDGGTIYKGISVSKTINIKNAKISYIPLENISPSIKWNFDNSTVNPEKNYDETTSLPSPMKNINRNYNLYCYGEISGTTDIVEKSYYTLSVFISSDEKINNIAWGGSRDNGYYRDIYNIDEIKTESRSDGYNYSCRLGLPNITSNEFVITCKIPEVYNLVNFSNGTIEMIQETNINFNIKSVNSPAVVNLKNNNFNIFGESINTAHALNKLNTLDIVDGQNSAKYEFALQGTYDDTNIPIKNIIKSYEVSWKSENLKLDEYSINPVLFISDQNNNICNVKFTGYGEEYLIAEIVITSTAYGYTPGNSTYQSSTIISVESPQNIFISEYFNGVNINEKDYNTITTASNKILTISNDGTICHRNYPILCGTENNEYNTPILNQILSKYKFKLDNNFSYNEPNDIITKNMLIQLFENLSFVVTENVDYIPSLPDYNSTTVAPTDIENANYGLQCNRYDCKGSWDNGVVVADAYMAIGKNFNPYWIQANLDNYYYLNIYGDAIVSLETYEYGQTNTVVPPQYLMDKFNLQAGKHYRFIFKFQDEIMSGFVPEIKNINVELCDKNGNVYESNSEFDGNIYAGETIYLKFKAEPASGTSPIWRYENYIDFNVDNNGRFRYSDSGKQYTPLELELIENNVIKFTNTMLSTDMDYTEVPITFTISDYASKGSMYSEYMQSKSIQMHCKGPRSSYPSQDSTTTTTEDPRTNNDPNVNHTIPPVMIYTVDGENMTNEDGIISYTSYGVDDNVLESGTITHLYYYGTDFSLINDFIRLELTILPAGSGKKYNIYEKYANRDMVKVELNDNMWVIEDASKLNGLSIYVGLENVSTDNSTSTESFDNTTTNKAN